MLRDQSVSSSIIRAVWWGVVRNLGVLMIWRWMGGGLRGFVLVSYHLKALRCPSQASALPLLILLCSSARKCCTSLSVHSGCSGIVMSRSVRFAAHSRLARRGERACETARMAPKPSVELAGTSVVVDRQGKRGAGVIKYSMIRLERIVKRDKYAVRCRSIACLALSS